MRWKQDKAQLYSVNKKLNRCIKKNKILKNLIKDLNDLEMKNLRILIEKPQSWKDILRPWSERSYIVKNVHINQNSLRIDVVLSKFHRHFLEI